MSGVREDQRGRSRAVGSGRARVLEAAMQLFTEHSVSGTSLQMVADTLGVTKAAVYYHFRTKEDLVRAVVEPAIADLQAVVRAARVQRSQAARAEAVLAGLLDANLRNRRLLHVMQFDVGVVAMLGDDPTVPALRDEFVELLAGPDADGTARVTAAMALSGLIAATDPTVATLDDDTLREVALDNARAMARRIRRSTT